MNWRRFIIVWGLSLAFFCLIEMIMSLTANRSALWINVLTMFCVAVFLAAASSGEDS